MLFFRGHQAYAPDFCDDGSSSGNGGPDIISLDSIDAVFGCASCQSTLIYPSMLRHDHLSETCKSWDVGLVVHQPLSRVIYALLLDVRFIPSLDDDPLNDFEKMGNRFVCLCCDPKSRTPHTWYISLPRFISCYLMQ
jgi:hypothetical protein